MNRLLELQNEERDAHNAVGDISRRLNQLRRSGKAIDIEEAIEEKGELTSEWLAAQKAFKGALSTRGLTTAHSDLTEGRYITGGVRKLIEVERDKLLDRGSEGWDVRFLSDMLTNHKWLSDKQASNLVRIIGV